MIVRICPPTSDHDTARAVRARCASFGDLRDEWSVATACGACHDCACGSFEWRAAQAACAAGGVAVHGAAVAPPTRRVTVFARPVAGQAAGA